MIKVAEWMLNKAEQLDDNFLDEEIKALKVDLKELRELKEREINSIDEIDDTIARIDKLMERYNDKKLVKYRVKLGKMRVRFKEGGI